ncbi:MAG: hypothetical protein ACP6IP_09060 [Candidatus Njordarchaeia archaeon]
MKRRRIAIECKPDKRLILWILNQIRVKTKVYHRPYKGGKGSVFEIIKNESNILAIIDEDPDAPKHPLYDQLKKVYTSDSLNVYAQKGKNNIVIEIRPRLEAWVLKIIKEAKIKSRQSRNERRLHAEFSARPNKIVEILNMAKNKSRILDELIEKIKESI